MRIAYCIIEINCFFFSTASEQRSEPELQKKTAPSRDENTTYTKSTMQGRFADDFPKKERMNDRTVKLTTILLIVVARGGKKIIVGGNHSTACEAEVL